MHTLLHQRNDQAKPTISPRGHVVFKTNANYSRGFWLRNKQSAEYNVYETWNTDASLLQLDLPCVLSRRDEEVIQASQVLTFPAGGWSRLSGRSSQLTGGHAVPAAGPVGSPNHRHLPREIVTPPLLPATSVGSRPGPLNDIRLIW